MGMIATGRIILLMLIVVSFTGRSRVWPSTCSERDISTPKTQEDMHDIQDDKSIVVCESTEPNDPRVIPDSMAPARFL